MVLKAKPTRLSPTDPPASMLFLKFFLKLASYSKFVIFTRDQKPYKWPSIKIEHYQNT
jgi:hypothetical protein